MPSRPQGRAAFLQASEQRALIPARRMDFPTQRFWAAGIFALLLALKTYDAVIAYWAPHLEQNAGIIKWAFIDSLYIAALWFAQIPWLQFTVCKSIWLAVMLIFSDLLLFTLPSAVLGGVLWKVLFDEVGQQIGVSQAKMINVKDVWFNSSHILGRHTVILPFGAAKLNPDNEFYCIPSDEIGKKDILIPIILNNTSPRSIAVSRFDFDAGSRTTHDYTGRDIQRVTEFAHGKQGIERYYIRVRKPGAYKLENIVSKDGFDVRLYSRQAYVFLCPTARFKPLQPVDYCRGEKESLQLEVIGIPPLKVEYKRRIGADESSLELDRIQPNEFDSPLARLSKGLVSADPSFFVPSTHTDYDWAARQHLTIQLNLTLEHAEQYEYQLSKVIDGAGNEVELLATTKQALDVHEHPTVEFQCNPSDPIKLLKGKKSVDLPLHMDKGSAPWYLDYEYIPDKEEGTPEHLKARLDTPHGAFEATLPGEYKLLSVSDKYCKGKVLLPSTCQVVQPPLPQVEIQATPIPSDCAGDSEIGMSFTAEFQGTPPFLLSYNVIRQTGKIKNVETKREKSYGTRHTFAHRPESGGEYTYEFNALNDEHYKDQNPSVPSIKQVVHPQPDAKFGNALRGRKEIRTCLGEEIRLPGLQGLPVKLSGSGPFKLYWTLGKQMYSDTVEDDTYTISLPPPESAGTHVVSLVKIEDANECVKELDSRDIRINVRRDRPTAFFYTDDNQSNTLLTTENKQVRLPLRLTGESPWTLSYRNLEDKNGKVHEVKVDNPNAHLPVRDRGEYEIVTVEDASCRGDVLPPNYIVRWIDKPALSIAEQQVSLLRDSTFERRAVCAGTNDLVDVHFTGQGPYWSRYSIKRADVSKRGFAPVGSDEIRSGLSNSRVLLQTQTPGRYRYVFDELSDQRYTQALRMANPVTLEQTVHANPTARFAQKSNRQRVLCVGDSLESNEMEPLWVELSGEAPFTVTVSVQHHSSRDGRVMTLENLDSKRFKLSLPYLLETAGQHTLQLLSVSDANGCETMVNKADATVVVEALGIAVINPIDTCAEVCVGDNIDFSLSGVSPFTVLYQFNGHDEKIKSQTSKLSMIADKPGNLTIVSVGDQRNKCRSFPKDMTKIVHEVPSSLVSGGKEIIENIREGEMAQAVVDLVGTPPFDFEWRRSEVVWDHQKKRHHKGRVLESHVVHGVQENRYVINTSTEGIIEVVSIKDRFCHYPRAL